MTRTSNKMTNKMNRRTLLQATSVATAALFAPASLRSAQPQQVVVAGGGFAGATAAKYLRLWGGDGLSVVLVDPNPDHTSCVMSNLVLDGALQLSDLQFSLTELEKYGVDYVQDTVDEVNPAAMTVRLGSGASLGYDKLVLSGGVSFKSPTGWDPQKSPHAWIAGEQTTLLRDRLEAMPDNGTFVLTIPKSPYRCPPGPYERACTVASVLRERGGGAKVLVLDANPGIQAEKVTFSKAFFDLYADIIEYRTDVEILGVDSDAGLIHAAGETHSGDLLNIIPTHQASTLVRQAGLVPSGGDWAPVDPLSYESLLAGFENIHVIGDSQGTGQPKSGHMANAQAKVCTDAILRMLNGEPIDTPERMASVTTNSACFSPITSTEASWLTAVFAYDSGADQMRLKPGSLAEAGEWTTDNYKDMFVWADNLWTDTFR